MSIMLREQATVNRMARHAFTTDPSKWERHVMYSASAFVALREFCSTDRTWMDADHCDSPREQFAAKSIRETFHSIFCAGIHCHRWNCETTHVRAHIQNK